MNINKNKGMYIEELINRTIDYYWYNKDNIYFEKRFVPFKILKIMNNNGGYITTKELDENNINRYFLTKMVERKKINRISRGYYGLVDYNVDEYYKIISMSERAVFSMNTALYLHNLSDRTPLIFDITVPYYYGGIYKP